MDNSDISVHDKLKSLLDNGKARYRLVQHTAAGKSEEVALARGTEIGQGAKALVCELLFDNAVKANVLAVMPADRQLDKTELARSFGAKKAKLLGIDATRALTKCEIGAIPPFIFSPDIILVCDPQLIERYSTIAFNAGKLDISMLLNTEDYLALAKPQLMRITASPITNKSLMEAVAVERL